MTTLLVLLLLLLPAPAFAVPTVTWDGPWAVRLPIGDTFTGFVATGGSDRLPGTNVVRLFGTSDALPVTLSDGGAHSLLDFIRPLTLAGAPDGWALTIEGLLTAATQAIFTFYTFHAIADGPVVTPFSHTFLLSNGAYIMGGQLSGGLLERSSVTFDIAAVPVVAAVPEPSTGLLLAGGLGLLGLRYFRRR
jgi:hypothetical protein